MLSRYARRWLVYLDLSEKEPGWWLIGNPDADDEFSIKTRRVEFYGHCSFVHNMDRDTEAKGGVMECLNGVAVGDVCANRDGVLARIDLARV